MSSDSLHMKRREFAKVFPHLKEWYDEGLWVPPCFYGSVGQSGAGGCGRCIQNQEKPNAEMLYTLISESDVRGSDYKQGLEINEIVCILPLL